MNEAMLEILIPTASALLCCVVSIVAVFLVNVLKNLAKKLNLELNDATYDHIDKLVTTIVVATNQKIVSKLKEQNPDGKLTEEQQEYIFNSVRELVEAGLSVAEIEYLTTKFGNLTTGIEQMIEAAVAYNHTSVLVSYGEGNTVETSVTITEE